MKTVAPYVRESGTGGIQLVIPHNTPERECEIHNLTAFQAMRMAGDLIDWLRRQPVSVIAAAARSEPDGP